MRKISRNDATGNRRRDVTESGRRNVGVTAGAVLKRRRDFCRLNAGESVRLHHRLHVDQALLAGLDQTFRRVVEIYDEHDYAGVGECNDQRGQ